MQLSKNFSLEELTKSEAAIRHGISNEPHPEAVENLKALAVNILQPLRDAVGPIKVNSGFRGKAVNDIINGSETSQHMFGEAADIESVNFNTLDLAKKIIEMKLPFDQLILEFYRPGVPDSGWVHVSYRSPRGRGMVLTAAKQGRKTVYSRGLVA